MPSAFRSRFATPAPAKLVALDPLDCPSDTGSGSGRKRLATFASLPTEIHLLISKRLIYPDALSLKHTSRHFYSLVDTGVRLKVEWLVERRMLHLECPNNIRCDLGSDLRFCRGSVACVAPFLIDTTSTFTILISTCSLLMQRRREHVECESRPGLGCLVYGTSVCTHRRDLNTIWKRWARSRVTIELWWVLLATIPCLFGWLWIAEFFDWKLRS